MRLEYCHTTKYVYTYYVDYVVAGLNFGFLCHRGLGWDGWRKLLHADGRDGIAGCSPKRWETTGTNLTGVFKDYLHTCNAKAAASEQLENLPFLNLDLWWNYACISEKVGDAVQVKGWRVTSHLLIPILASTLIWFCENECWC